MSRSGRRMGVILGLGCCVLTTPARSQEYCVACTEPPAVYRCVIDGAQPGGRQPLQTLCVMAMTKEGRHAVCSVKGGTVFDCNGPVKRVPWAAYNTGAAEPVPAAQAPATKKADEPPRTVEEAVKRASDTTAVQLKQANEKLKNQAQSVGQGASEATRKTWACIASFFTRCGE